MDPIVSGGVVAVFSFGIARGWDVYTTTNRRVKRDRAVVAALEQELKSDREITANNRELVRHELKLIGTGSSTLRLLNPLDPVASGWWDLIRLEPPRGLVDADALVTLQHVWRRVGQVNAMVDSRERYRVANPMSGMFAAHMKQYDELIDRFAGELLEAIDRATGLLEEVPTGTRFQRWRSRLHASRLLPGGDE
ncbi:MAG: hypothetical protein ACJ760_14095 [Thermoleophilaceae bacterium]